MFPADGEWQSAFCEACPLGPRQMGTERNKLHFPIHAGRRHHGEMRICIPSCKLPLLGSFMTSVYRDIATGEKLHPRSTGKLLLENAAFDGVEKRHWLTHDFCAAKGIEKINGRMFRYIYPLTKRAHKVLKAYPQYGSLAYPKEQDLYFALRVGPKQYARIPAPRFDRDAHHYNPQTY